MNDIADAALLRRTAAGDDAAFEAFVTRHEAWLHGYARALAGPAADELFQDAFVAAWKGAGTFAGDQSARPWLATIARNAWHRRFRRRVGEPRTFESVDELGQRAGWGAPDAALDRADARQTVHAALARLPDDEREAVVLRDLEGLDTSGAATAAGVTIAALKSRLHRGRLRLAAILRESAHA